MATSSQRPDDQDIYTIIVGPRQQQLFVLRDILVKTPYFSAALSSGAFIESTTKVFHLPEDNAQVVTDIIYRFDSYRSPDQEMLELQNWLRADENAHVVADIVYRITGNSFSDQELLDWIRADNNTQTVAARLIHRNNNNPFSNQGLLDWVRAYVTADRLMATDVTNALFHDIVRAFDSDHMYPEAFDILYDAGLEATPLFDTLINTAAFHSDKNSQSEIVETLADTLDDDAMQRLVTALADSTMQRYRYVSSTGCLRINVSEHECTESCSPQRVCSGSMAPPRPYGTHSRRRGG